MPSQGLPFKSKTPLLWCKLTFGKQFKRSFVVCVGRPQVVIVNLFVSIIREAMQLPFR